MYLPHRKKHSKRDPTARMDAFLAEQARPLQRSASLRELVTSSVIPGCKKSPKKVDATTVPQILRRSLPQLHDVSCFQKHFNDDKLRLELLQLILPICVLSLPSSFPHSLPTSFPPYLHTSFPQSLPSSYPPSLPTLFPPYLHTSFPQSLYIYLNPIINHSFPFYLPSTISLPLPLTISSFFATSLLPSSLSRSLLPSNYTSPYEVLVNYVNGCVPCGILGSRRDILLLLLKVIGVITIMKFKWFPNSRSKGKSKRHQCLFMLLACK